MCGRLYQTLPLLRLLKIANAKSSTNPEQFTSSYNVCPTTYIPAIKPSKLYLETKKQSQDNQLQKQQNRELEFMSWGHKSHFNFIVNGRIEQMLNKKTFLNFIENRCVVIMQGYYEWNQKKQPFSFRPKDTDHFLVAALYTDNKEIIILTKDATPQLSAVHHRMPVILSHEQVNLWLNPKNTKIINDAIQKSLLKKQKQIWKNVGCAKLAPYVSSIKEKSSKCLMSIQDYKKQLDKNGLMRFWKKAPVIEAVNKQGNVVKSSVTQKATPVQENAKQQMRDFVLKLEQKQNKVIKNQQDNQVKRQQIKNE